MNSMSVGAMTQFVTTQTRSRKGSNMRKPWEEKYIVMFTDVDGTNYICHYGTKESWSTSMDSGEAMMFSFMEACRVRDELEQLPRYQGGPDEGFYRLRMRQATEEEWSNWCGPSGELIGYLAEGNTKEDLVRLLWEKMSLQQRDELEAEASEFLEEFCGSEPVPYM